MTSQLGKVRFVSRALVVIIPMAVFFVATPAQAAPSYTSVQDLGSFGGNITQVRAVNALGHAAGTSTDSSGADHAFLFNGSSMVQACTLLRANDVNDSDLVVGELQVKSHGTTVSRPGTCQGSTMTNLGTLGGSNTSVAWGVNNAGQVVGQASSRSGDHAFLYSNGRMTDLGTFGGLESSAAAINSQGTVVGYADFQGDTGNPHAFVWDASSGMRDLGTLPGYAASSAADINDHGTIVGASCAGTTSDCSLVSAGHAFMILDGSGPMIDLGTLPGDVRSEAVAVNNNDQVLGRSYDAFGNSHPFLYADGTMYDLGQLSSVGMRDIATDINDSGQIAAFNSTIPVGSSLYSQSLLTRYEPLLVYDSQEQFEADSAAEITDSYEPGIGSNILYSGTGSILAAADPSYASDNLSLDYLTGPPASNVYPSGLPVSSGDYIDELGDDTTGNYVTDYNNLHALPQYRDQVYGREIDNINEGIFLQYWFFYYYNGPRPLNIGNHEGDWEMAQIEINRSTGQPVAVTVSQHNGGEYCAWANVEKVEGRPILYPAQGSHANYFSPGVYQDGLDVNDGNGEEVIPSVESLDPTPSWIDWPGTWGASFGSFPSPVGPSWHDSWQDPLTWQSNAPACSGPQAPTTNKNGVTVQTRAIAPRGDNFLPARYASSVVDVHRVGDQAVIRYDFQRWPKSAGSRPWQVITSVKSSGDRYTPQTVISTVHGQRGRISQPVGPGHGPFRILVSVATRNGGRTRVISLPLR